MRQRIRNVFVSFSKKSLGVLCLLAVVLIWVVSGELIEYIFKDEKFNAPFFLTYFNTSLFSLYLLGFLIRPLWWPNGPPKALFWLHWSCCQKSRPKIVADVTEDAPKHVSEDDDEETTQLNLQQDSTGSLVKKEEPEMYTLKDVLIIALGFCPLWFAANYFYNFSLTMTTVASATILSSTSSLFTFCLGFVLKVEKASIWKIVGILVTLLGVVLVSLTDTTSGGYNASSGGGGIAGSNATGPFLNVTRVSGHGNGWSSLQNIIGDMFALLGAVAYAGYAIYLKVKIKNEEAFNLNVFFGFVGLLNILIMWPLGFILHFTGVEVFAVPSLKVLGFLAVNGIVGTVISDYLWILAVLLASPVIATVGLSLTIPLSMIADSILHTETFSAMYIVGAILTLMGFVFVNTTDLSEVSAWLKTKCSCCCKKKPSLN